MSDLATLVDLYTTKYSFVPFGPAVEGATQVKNISSFFRQNRIALLYGVWLSVVPLLVSSTLAFYALRYEAQIGEATWPFWLLFYVLAIPAMALAFTPTTFIALLSGYFLGWLSVGPVCLSYLAASAMGYQMARLVDGGRLLAGLENNKRAAALISRLQNRSTGVIILSRLSPALPFAVMNLVLAAIGVPFVRFLWAGFIGMLPRTLLSIGVAHGLNLFSHLLDSQNNPTFTRVALGLTLVSFAGLYLIFRRFAKGPTEVR